jgi:hypothetical protein
MNLNLRVFSELRPDAVLQIVGEASYQEPLSQLAGARGVQGVSNIVQSAVLVREPANKYDRNAIAVYLRQDAGSMTKVGYLSRDDALAYGPFFAYIVPDNGIMVPASLKGGWVRYGEPSGSIGVELNLGTPAEMAAGIFCKAYGPAAPHSWASKLVAFTGESSFAIAGMRLDHFAQRTLAEHAGCTTWPRVTKKVQVCVASEDETNTGNLRKAEEYGIELVRESDFWAAMGFRLEHATFGAPGRRW